MPTPLPNPLWKPATRSRLPREPSVTHLPCCHLGGIGAELKEELRGKLEPNVWQHREWVVMYYHVSHNIPLRTMAVGDCTCDTWAKHRRLPCVCKSAVNIKLFKAAVKVRRYEQHTLDLKKKEANFLKGVFVTVSPRHCHPVPHSVAQTGIWCCFNFCMTTMC